ncbi:hypothetical protein [Xanthobacter sp. KR7-225]|uniref:hypothetical protein n=1 Tax=Xanthobacter sp. KR7-225 TaxID=3156613 RepID=UPI0032B4E5AA
MAAAPASSASDAPQDAPAPPAGGASALRRGRDGAYLSAMMPDDAKDARRAAALRANLARRKDQARARKAAAAATPAVSAGAPAGEDAAPGPVARDAIVSRDEPG